jgi:hypothetical protein
LEKPRKLPSPTPAKGQGQKPIKSAFCALPHPDFGA